VKIELKCGLGGVNWTPLAALWLTETGDNVDGCTFSPLANEKRPWRSGGPVNNSHPLAVRYYGFTKIHKFRARNSNSSDRSAINLQPNVEIYSILPPSLA